MYCLSCGAENNDSANFCQSCGATRDLFRIMPSGHDEVTQVSQSFKQPQYSPKSNNQNIVLVLAGIIVVIAVAAAGYFYAKSETAKQTPTNQVVNNVPTQKGNDTQSESSNSPEVQSNQGQIDIEKAQQLKVRKESVWKQLDDQLEQRAMTEAQQKHQYSKFNGKCIQVSNNIENQTGERITFSRAFDCPMKGALLGVRTFTQRITIRAEFIQKGEMFSGTILEVN